MNTVILISFDSKFLLDKVKEGEGDASRGYDLVIKRLADFYKKGKELS